MLPLLSLILCTVQAEVPEIYSRRPVAEVLTAAEWHGHPCAAIQFGTIRDGRLRVADRVATAEAAIGTFRELKWGDAEDTHQFLLMHADRWQVRLREAAAAVPDGGDPGAFLRAASERGVFRYFEPADSHGLFPVTMFFKGVRGDDGALIEFRPYSWSEATGELEFRIREDYMTDFRVLADTLTQIVAADLLDAIESLEERTDLAAIRWDNYLQRGFSQLPWESVVNSWMLDESVLGPPDHQWLLLHPGIAVELGPTDTNLRAKETLSVEVLGHLWYVGPQLENYWGLSAVVNLRDDMDPGYGGLVRFGRGLNLGAVWRSEADAPFLFFTFDVYSLVGASPMDR